MQTGCYKAIDFLLQKLVLTVKLYSLLTFSSTLPGLNVSRACCAGAMPVGVME
jgi:hypothetical protein